MSPSYEPYEIMTVVAARSLPDQAVCFVGIGLPSAAANPSRAAESSSTKRIFTRRIAHQFVGKSRFCMSGLTASGANPRSVRGCATTSCNSSR